MSNRVRAEEPCRREWYTGDEPTDKFFHRNGTPWLYMWRCHGRHHREDGPAVERYCKKGSIDGAAYCLDGERMLKEEYRRRVALRKLMASAIGKSEVSL